MKKSNSFDKPIFELPKVKRFVVKLNLMSFTKNGYSKPTPPDMQFEERFFQTQFSVSADKLYEWNINNVERDFLASHVSPLKITT